MRAQSRDSPVPAPPLSLSWVIGRVVTMRRLHQVILATVAVASLLGFLLYKHEYDRLSNLLQVLNTFGAESASVRTCDPEGGPGGLHAPHDPLGVWQQIENVYVYSAFLEAGVATVLGVVPSSISPKDIGVSRCLFWYEPESPDRKPRLADLTVKFADEESDSPQESWKLITLSCSAPSPSARKDGRLYAVSLLSSTQPESSTDNLPQILLQEAAAPPSNNVSLGVCATLRSPHTDPVLLTQFVKFHRQVGATKFTFYNLGISPTIQGHIQALAEELVDLKVSVLAWNFPFEFTESDAPLASHFLQSDCVARHMGTSYVLFSPISMLVVPVYHSHATNLLQDEDAVGGNLMGQMRLKEHVFCAELEDNPYTKALGAGVWPMYLKTSWVKGSDPGAQNDYFLLKPTAVRTILAGGGLRLKTNFIVREVEEDVAVVHSYRKCGSLSVTSPNYDNSMMRRFLKLIQ